MQEEEPKMTTKKMEELPAWLQSVNSKTTTKTPDWFASFTTAKSAMTTEEEESNPFQYKLKSGVASNFPVIEVNGPSIKLPSFPILSAPISMYSDIESRTDYGSQNADFDLEFFPQRMDGEDDKNTKFTLLVNEPKLGDLETTTTQRPLVTQSLSPMENREALSQLVSLYERAPILVKGETDKTQSKVMEKDKNTITMKMDPDYDEEK